MHHGDAGRLQDSVPGDSREIFVSYSGHLEVRVRVQPDRRDAGGVLDAVEPRDLPISDGLARDLEAQQDEFGPRWDLPWSAPTLEQRRRGWMLARRLAAELSDLEVYWRDMDGRYVSVYEAPAPH